MFEFLFIHSAQTWQNGTFYFASRWPLSLLILGVTLIFGFSALSSYRHKDTIDKVRLYILWLLQSLVGGTLLLMLWQPSLRVERILNSENSLAILLDTSSSMSLGENQSSRLQVALEALQSGPLDLLKQRFKTNLYAVSTDLQPLPTLQALSALGQQSNLGEALIEALEVASREPLAAVVLISDGSDNGAVATHPDWWNKLGQYGVPIYTVGVGREKHPEDLELLDVQLALTSIPGSVEPVLLTVRHGRGGLASLKVYDGENLVALHELELADAANESSYSLELGQFEAGVHELRFLLEPWEGEQNLHNNQQKRILQIAEKQKRVLYVEGEPRWEYKFIRRALHNNPGIRLVSLLRTSPNKFYRQGIESPDELIEGFPVDRTSLYSYDAVIIGSLDAAQLDATQHELLRDFVSVRGGSLLMLAGSEGLADGGWGRTAVSSALPVNLPDQLRPTFNRVKAKVQLNELALQSPITRLSNDVSENLQLWSQLPEIADYQLPGDPKPGAQTLLDAVVDNKKTPLLVLQRYGLGYSYVLATAGTWRWQMQLPSDDQRHETFWRNLLWSMVDSTPERLKLSQQKNIHTDRNVKSIGIDFKTMQFEPMPNAEVSITIDGPSGLAKTILAQADLDQQGTYQANFDADEAGIYRVAATTTDSNGQIITANTWVLQGGHLAENFSQQQNKHWLQRVADETGGKYLPVDTLEILPDLVDSENAAIVREQSLPLWNMPIFFLAILILKMIEWLLRRRWGRI